MSCVERAVPWGPPPNWGEDPRYLDMTIFQYRPPQSPNAELFIATMSDIQRFNKREVRIALEWAKTFDEYNQLAREDRVRALDPFF